MLSTLQILINVGFVKRKSTLTKEKLKTIDI